MRTINGTFAVVGFYFLRERNMLTMLRTSQNASIRVIQLSDTYVTTPTKIIAINRHNKLQSLAYTPAAYTAMYIAAVTNVVGRIAMMSDTMPVALYFFAATIFSDISMAAAATNPQATAATLCGMVRQRMIVIITRLIISNIRIIPPLLLTFRILNATIAIG